MRMCFAHRPASMSACRSRLSVTAADLSRQVNGLHGVSHGKKPQAKAEAGCKTIILSEGAYTPCQSAQLPGGSPHTPAKASTSPAGPG